MANHKISANNPDLLDLNQLLSDDNLKDPKKVLKALFPNLSEDQYSAVAEMSVAIILPRQRQHLGKALKWRPQRTANGYQSLDEKEIASFLQAIKELSASMPKEWNKISADEISLDWKRASSDDLPNSELWRNSLAGRGLFEAPHFTENDGFSLEVFPAVVNPDNPDQVWSIGSSIALSDISSGKITPQAWDNYLRQNKEQLEKEFGFEKDPRVLKPHVRLFWRITAPDGETFTLPRAEKEEWRQNANAKAWVHDRKVKIEEAYQKAALWAVYEAMYSARVQTPETSPDHSVEQKAEIQKQKLTDVLDKNFKMLDFDWDLFDQKAPNNLEEFDAMMQEMEVTNPQGFEKIKTYMTSVAPSVLYDKKGWATKRWLFANEFRDQISARCFLNDEDIENFMSSEQRFFVEEASKRDVLDYVSSLNDEEKLKFLDILYWNDCNVPEPVLNALTNNQVEEVAVAEQPQTAVKKNRSKQTLPC